MTVAYTIRESHRAKYVSLRMSANGKLEVVVPPGFNRGQIPEIVAQKRGWIEKARQKLASRTAHLCSETTYPDAVDLIAVSQRWHIEYRSGQGPTQLHIYSNQRLVVTGQIQPWGVVQPLLQRWVVRHARLHLLPWLAKLSQSLALPYSRAAVRSPRTRWGSCSSQQAISLNSKLIFLPSDLVHYVLVHELCHTVHFDHSPAFWSLVERFEPNYQTLRDRLKQADMYLPGWMGNE